MSTWQRCVTLTSAIVTALAMGSPASGQTKLKWAHVYEITEPFHTEALSAAGEIRKRTNGKFDIQVFPASQLGNEKELNEGLGLGTIDIVYVGINFVAATYKPLGITGAPFISITGRPIATASCLPIWSRATTTRPGTRSSRSLITASAMSPPTSPSTSPRT